MLYGKNLQLRALQLDDLSYLNKWRNDIDNKMLAQSYRLPVTSKQDKNWFENILIREAVIE